VLFEFGDEAETHFAGDVPLFGWDGAGDDGDCDEGASEVGDAFDVGDFGDFIFPFGVVEKFLADGVDDFDGFFDVVIVADADIEETVAVAHGLVDDVDEGAVWEEVDVAV